MVSGGTTSGKGARNYWRTGTSWYGTLFVTMKSLIMISIKIGERNNYYLLPQAINLITDSGFISQYCIHLSDHYLDV